MVIMINIILFICIVVNVISIWKNIKTYKAMEVLNAGDLIVHEYVDSGERTIAVNNLDLTKLNDSQYVVFKTTIIEVRD